MDDGSLDPTGDPQQLLDRLADNLGRALPSADGVEVSRERSMGDRLAGRPGRVVAVALLRGQTSLSLRLDGRRLKAEQAHVVGGVVLSRSTPTVGAWLTALAAEVAAAAGEAAGDAASATRALRSLGVTPTHGTITLPVRDLEGGLRALPDLVAGRLPESGTEAVRRIAALLLDALPRVVGNAEQEGLVRRTATRYLPDTLDAYLALPADWARTQPLAGGRTAEQALLDQLAELEAAVARMRDAALRQDAEALLVNGRFLADRFATSGLDMTG